MQAFIYYPEWMSAEIIPGLPFRWYAVTYLIAFGIAYLLMKYQAKHDPIEDKLSENEVSSFVFWVIWGLIIGARLFGTLVYDKSGLYWEKPYLIVFPFQNGKFTGLQGMSYHGGLIGGLLAAFFFCRKYKKNYLALTDMAMASIPLGYTFGRIGNFLNAELYGKVTASPIGMIFPTAPAFSIKDKWVENFVQNNGLEGLVNNGMINLPRYPSQLYEAFFEGVALWLVLWFIFRKRRKFDGQMLSLYLIGYGVARFFIEYAREPDNGIGYVIKFFPSMDNIHLFQTYFNFSLGQIFCLLMIFAGIGSFFFFKARAVRLAKNAEETKPKKSARQIRKKIK